MVTAIIGTPLASARIGFTAAGTVDAVTARSSLRTDHVRGEGLCWIFILDRVPQRHPNKRPTLTSEEP